MELWLDRTARERPAAIAIAPELTYAELDEMALAAAQALAAGGVGAGDRVATTLSGSDLVTLLHALPKLGAVLVPINPRLTEREEAELLAAVPPRLVVRDPVPGTRGDSPPVPGTRGDSPPVPGTRGDSPRLRGRVDPNEAHTVVFTSGTTGRPKPVTLTYENHQASAAAVAAAFGTGPDTRWLCPMPLFHVGGLAIAIRAAIGGFAVHLHEGFDAAAVKAELEAGAVTHVSLVPTMLARLRDAGLTRAPGVRHVILGGGPIPPELLAWARGAGLPVTATYGMTETASMVATAAGPLPGVEIKVADGELLVRGPMVAADGWLRTGDRGSLDERGLHVEGRIADTIITGGENVSAREVEEVLLAHPDVADAAVVGRPDPDWGEVVIAFVAGGEADLVAWCRQRLAGYKVPKEFHRVAEIPRTATGKVLRHRLG